MTDTQDQIAVIMLTRGTPEQQAEALAYLRGVSHIHSYTYQGTVYWLNERPLPGSGAHARIYADRYFCETCLDTQLRNERTHGNSYDKPLPGTLPR